MTDRYAVIGHPVAHSLSPAIHAAFAEATGQDLHYGLLEAPHDGFAAAAERFLTRGRGLNVTLPFKLDAWRWVDEHDVAAADAGAVNTVVPVGHRWRGCNTDGVGLVADLTRLGWPLTDARTLILGAGGAVQGVVGALRDAGVADLTVANRTRSKADAVADRFGIRALGLDDVGTGWDLVINGTSAGLSGQGGVTEGTAVANSRCYDLVYRRDGRTPFCAWAAEHGAASVADGLGMLVEQAAEAFHLWRGVRPDTQPVLATLRTEPSLQPS